MTDFQPSWGLRNAHVQSVLASTGIRRWRIQRGGAMIRAQQQRIVTCADGTRLHAYVSVHEPAARAPALVVLLHGWEGCHESTYMLRTGEHLFRRGFDVVRLNFRDHGDSHHLNEELFHSCRIDEVVQGVAAVQAELPRPATYLAGFSLGGNFTLRVALRAPAAGIRLNRVFAVSPVICPRNALHAIETAPRMYQHYFISKWRESLLRKRDHFPDRYAQDPWPKLQGLRALTEHMVLKHTDFPTVDDYFAGYSIAGDILRDLEIPATVITSEDDPIIPVRDYHGLPDNDALDLTITRLGGHCGFVHNWRLQGWMEGQISSAFLADLERR